jgi:hypothetical protein
MHRIKFELASESESREAINLDSRVNPLPPT